jgi:hypothetical protein
MSLNITPRPQRVTLRHISHQDDIGAAGLLLTECEIYEWVEKCSPALNLEKEPLDVIYSFTTGYPCSIGDLLHIISVNHLSATLPDCFQ